MSSTELPCDDTAVAEIAEYLTQRLMGSHSHPLTKRLDDLQSWQVAEIIAMRVKATEQTEDPTRSFLRAAIDEAYSDAAADAQEGAKYVAPEQIHLYIEQVEELLAKRKEHALDGRTHANITDPNPDLCVSQDDAHLKVCDHRTKANYDHTTAARSALAGAELMRERLQQFFDDEYLWDTAKALHADENADVDPTDRAINALLERLAKEFGLNAG